MRMALIREDTWTAISEESPNPVTEEFRRKDAKAWASIGLCIEDSRALANDIDGERCVECFVYLS